MLKRLDLAGFKSFADKTVFDFGDGITAIVGPNGSGKSNIVDAVRWILGEQSAKSLRGGEMADVIFNGSTARRSFGMAEVTMTFDNSRRLLSTPTDEVQITRRVYRGGEGEYLINHQLCRLRDIKEMFLGSGAGADAYCIIEQGRVDVLLQASTKERRTIFEEAAGISRFKAKKIETLRKLERVDQNVLRLRDIIDEVEKQLRSVKLQAAKAQRYHEYSSRLKELRVALGLREYHVLSQRLTMESAVLERLRVELAERSAQTASWEADMQRLETALARLDDAVRQHEGHFSNARAQITAAQTTLGHEATLSEELTAELSRTRLRQAELNAKVTVLDGAVERAGMDVRDSQTQAEQQQQQLRALVGALQATMRRLSELHIQLDLDKAEHLEQMRRAAHLQNDTVSQKSQIENLRRERERLQLKTDQATQNLAALDVELRNLSESDSALQQHAVNGRQGLADGRQERERVARQRDETVDSISQLRQQRSGLVSRVEVLEGLERSHEGLGAGVREVFQLTELAEPGPWRTVVGMTADFLTVEREHAHLIDLVLGDSLQRFVVRDVALLDEALAARRQPFSGRVSFLPLKAPGSVGAMIDVSASSNGVAEHPGVVARAAQLVSCDHPELTDLPAQLLGETLIMRDLHSARALAARGASQRMITLAGELLEPDGTLTLGSQHADTGILSRKSELRELRQQLLILDFRLAEAEQEAADLREKLAGLDQTCAALQQELDALSERATDMRSRLERHRDRRQGLLEEVSVREQEMRQLTREIETLEESWQAAAQAVAVAESRVLALQSRLEAGEGEVRALEQARGERDEGCTAAKVALAKVEERHGALRAQFEQLERDLEQRRGEAADSENNTRNFQQRLQDSQATMLKASAALALWHLEKEAAEQRVAELTSERNAHRLERSRLASQAQTLRAQWRDQQEQVHARELEINDLEHQRATITDRLREDYQLELAEMYAQASFSRESRTSASDVPALDAPVDADTNSPGESDEIAELRRKLSRLGSVNLDALDELNELETRAGVLQAQFDDLTSAKRSLEEIINKINHDSRQLFVDSFNSIRTHFQELFRKLFGGGMADVVLEDESDILESGIEIIAKPPGKELRSISLMSGGEKTLTAVALLLAIFRSKPSPFCILDEVDAALDEANIGRFTAVLREFLDQSQFILITHSKRTMATADVLYGITMQESGISKRVAVRFEDWPEDRNDESHAPADRNGHERVENAVLPDASRIP